MLSRDVIDSLFPSDLPEPEHWEQRYPPRDLPEGAQVTRFSPSPTGFLHIGGVYAATIDVDVARDEPSHIHIARPSRRRPDPFDARLEQPAVELRELEPAAAHSTVKAA